MDKISILEQEIILLKERNIRVDENKAWETSIVRKVSIAFLTYITILSFFFVIHVEKPFINALVPVIGFLLSTLSVSLIKKLWIQYFYKK